MSRRVVYLPSKYEFVKYLTKILEPPSGAKMLDLGCGDGRILEAFARVYDDVKVYGIDINRELVRKARKNLSKYGFETNIKVKDMYGEALEKYDIVYAYLTKDSLSHLRSKIVKLLVSGGMFVTHDYPVPGLEPEKVHLVDFQGDKHYIFVYFDKGRVKRSLLKGLKI